jgi:ABC-2 type transport system ATP-binding protein
MQRRLMLAATLIHEPDLIFLDEPTAGIDPILREQLWQEFRNLQASGRTQVVTTQYIAEAEYCDTVVLMDRGRIVASGPPDTLRQQASGGDLIDVTIPDLDRPLIGRLRTLSGVRSLRFHGDDQLRLTVENAGELIPQIIATVQESGSTVQAIEEHRLSFNDVFVTLLKASGRDVSGTEEYGE